MKDQSTTKKSFFDNPILRTRVKSANAKIFPEGLIGFFLGPTLALISNSVLSSYLNTYFTNVLDMNNWAATFFTILPVISVIFVVAGNILVGRLMDHLKTRAGKARPILLLALPLCILALLVIFIFSPFATADSEGSTQMLALVLLAIGYNLWFAIAYPLYFTPHSALVNLSTRNSTHRSLLATISNATTLAAMGLCSMILPFFLGLLFRYADAAFIEANNIANAFDVIKNGVHQYYTYGEGGAIIYDQVASYNAWKVFVSALMIVNTVGIILEYMFTRERITEETMNKGADAAEEPKKKAVPVLQQLKVCFKDKYWWIIIGLFFFYQLGGMLKNTSQLYFCQAMFGEEVNGVMTYSTSIGGTFQGTLSIIGAIPTALGMVLAWPLSYKIGKARAIVCGSVVAVIGGIIGMIAPDNFALVVTSFVIKALGSTPAMYLSLALLADVIDHEEAMSGIRTDGLTMTIYGAIMAGMTGIATGILNAVISACGYNVTEGIVSNDALRTAMPWIFIGGETICYGLILIICLFMGVERFGKFDHKAIIKDQRALAEAEGKTYEPPAVVMAREEAEANAAAEEQRKAELKARCEKKGMDYEAEEAKYQEAQAAKKAAAEAKKAAADAKKAEKEAAAKAAYEALSAEEKAKVDEAKAAKEAKAAAYEAKVFAEFNELRKERGLSVLTEDDIKEEDKKDDEAAEAPAEAEAPVAAEAPADEPAEAEAPAEEAEADGAEESEEK